MILERNVFIQCRSINGKTYIVYNGNVYELDDVGYLFWNLIDGKTTIDQIAEKIFNIYSNVNQENIRRDLINFAQELLDQKLAEEVPS